MKKMLMSLTAATALLTSAGTQVAQAQFAVIDPANLVENIISALQNVQTVLNQVTQISHEIESLAYQVQNLQKMPAGVSSGVLGQYTTQFSKLVTSMQSINGIAQKRRDFDLALQLDLPHDLARARAFKFLKRNDAAGPAGSINPEASTKALTTPRRRSWAVWARILRPCKHSFRPQAHLKAHSMRFKLATN